MRVGQRDGERRQERKGRRKEKHVNNTDSSCSLSRGVKSANKSDANFVSVQSNRPDNKYYIDCFTNKQSITS